MNHENLDDITPDAKYNEIVKSKKCIEDNGFKVNSFSYPFNSGDDDQEILELISNTYDFARTDGGEGGSYAGSDLDGNSRLWTIHNCGMEPRRRKEREQIFRFTIVRCLLSFCKST